MQTSYTFVYFVPQQSHQIVRLSPFCTKTKWKEVKKLGQIYRANEKQGDVKAICTSFCSLGGWADIWVEGNSEQARKERRALAAEQW